MEEYWNQEVEENNNASRIPSSSQVNNKHTLESEYDCHRRQLLRSQAIHANSGGWKEELRRYLHDMPADVTKNTDIIAWWAVSAFILFLSFTAFIYIFIIFRNILRNIQLFPTLLWIFVQFQQHLYLASGSFQQVLKLLQIVDRALEQIGLRSFKF
jgi:hypothetical protein